MPKLIKLKLDLCKIHGAKLIKENGRKLLDVTDCDLYEGSKGAVYLDAAAFDTTGGQYGDWRISQDVSKKFRDAGVKGQILGNGTNKDFGAPAQQPHRQSVPPPPPRSDDVPDEMPPF